MRNRPFLLCLATMCLSAVVALGDIGPFPAHRPRPQPSPVPSAPRTETELPTLDESTQIEMQSADVNVVLKPSTKSGRQTSILAEVTCNFQLHCIAARLATSRYTMSCPYATEGDRGPKCKRFSVEIDGKRSGSVREARWSAENGGNKPPEYVGYAWPTAIDRGATQTVTVKYSLLLPVTENTSAFTYILCTGASWRRPIGRETVRVRAESGLQIAPVRSRNLRPTAQTKKDLIWELKDFVPKEDIHVEVTRDDKR
jgi:hypothetical protein